ncbi:MAG: hypothetical protein IKF65_04035 [Clostridia bacterium]|nr:hypothetical protein [Clostridia bacterium]
MKKNTGSGIFLFPYGNGTGILFSVPYGNGSGILTVTDPVFIYFFTVTEPVFVITDPLYIRFRYIGRNASALPCRTARGGKNIFRFWRENGRRVG